MGSPFASFQAVISDVNALFFYTLLHATWWSVAVDVVTSFSCQVAKNWSLLSCWRFQHLDWEAVCSQWWARYTVWDNYRFRLYVITIFAQPLVQSWRQTNSFAKPHCDASVSSYYLNFMGSVARPSVLPSKTLSYACVDCSCVPQWTGYYSTEDWTGGRGNRSRHGVGWWIIRLGWSVP